MKRKFAVKIQSDYLSTSTSITCSNMPAAFCQINLSDDTRRQNKQQVTMNHHRPFQFDEKNLIYYCSYEQPSVAKCSFTTQATMSTVKVRSRETGMLVNKRVVITASGTVYMFGANLKNTIYGMICRATRMIPVPKSDVPSSSSAVEYMVDPSIGNLVIKFYQAKELNKKRSTTNEDPMMEANVLQMLHQPSHKHKNLADCIDCFQDYDGNLFIIMDFIEGKEVNDMLLGDGDHSPETQVIFEKDAKKMVREAIEGLSWLHYLGYAHCDMSLENLMYDSVNDRYVIIDHGMAFPCNRHNGTTIVKGQKYQEFPKDGTEVRSYSPYYSWVTSYPRQCGKTYYMAPELWSKEELIHPMLLDVWALGIMLCIAVTGIPPCERAATSDPHFKYIMADQLTPMYSSYGIQMPSAECMDLITKILKVNPLERPSLEEILNHPWMRE